MDKTKLNLKAEPYLPPQWPHGDNLACALCAFQYPTRSHLIRCEGCFRHGHLFQVCRPCIKRHEARYNDGRSRPNCFPLFCPGCCANLLKLKAQSQPIPQTACTHTEKINLTRLSQFRMVVPNLLYVIGIPKRLGKEDLLMQSKFFGQFGKIKRLLINSSTKDFYEQQGQCAVYIWYESELSVAIALRCLNGLKFSVSQAWRSGQGNRKKQD